MNFKLPTAKPLKALLTTALLLIIIWLGKLVIINTSIFSPLSVAMSQFHFSDIYFQWHLGHNTDAEEKIVIVNTTGLDRDAIASIVDSINTYHPLVLAVDHIFGEHADKDPIADSHLVAAITDCPNLVMAQLLNDNGEMEESFFVHDTPIRQGLANLNPNVVREIEPTFNGQKTFSAEIVDAAGIHLDSTKEQLIDFGLHIMRWQPAIDSEFYMAGLEGKIVILGDTSDKRDWHNIPVIINNDMRMSGTEIQALATAALLSPAPYHRLPSFWSIVLQILLLYAFCLLLHMLPQTMGVWIRSALQIVFILLMLPVCYLFFLSSHLILSPTLALVGFGLAGFAKNITDAIIKE